MNKDKIISLGIFILVIILFIVAILLSIQNNYISTLLNHEKTPEIGDKAFIFKESDLSGKTINIKDKNVLLIFFNVTCEKCRNSVHKWNMFFKKYNSRKINIVGISSERSQVTKKFINKAHIVFPVISDSNHNILWKYKVKYVPLFVLINRKGSILYYSQYDISVEDALNIIIQIIKKMEN